MKNLFRAIIFLAMGLLLIACGQSVTATPSPIPSPTITITATFTPIPSQTTTATIEATPRPEYVRPTLIPTIDPTLVPELFSKAFSIQTFDMNGYNIRRIIDWELGFGGGFCGGYNWLDSNHLILYPSVGQRHWGEGGQVLHLATQPVVINMDTGHFWLPPSNKSESPFNCRQLSWSRELKILITTEIHGDTSSVSTYTYDGRKLSSYTGQISAISPSGTKIILDENIFIDLQTNKRITLDWSLEDYYEPHLSSHYWTYPDETRIYRCCYFYADLDAGISHRFKRSEFQDTNGNHLDEIGLWFHQGEWVRNNKYFLVHWLAVDDGPVWYLPMFDPSTKLFYDVWEMAGIPVDFTWLYNDVSPDGNHMWIAGWGESYLVDLITFESLHYPYPEHPYTYPDVVWSADSKFVWFQIHDSDNKSTGVKILSISDMKLHNLLVAPQAESEQLWHPTDNIVVYPARDKNSLIFLDVSTMSFRELPFKDQDARYKISNLVWNPHGDRLVFITEDHILWKVDYPSLENLEQIIASTNTISGAQWSPNGNSVAFINGSDIYIVNLSPK